MFFMNELSSIVSLLEHNCKHSKIIAGDFNINMLKFHGTYSSEVDSLISRSLFTQETVPARINRTNGTLIDNTFLAKLVIVSTGFS